MLAGEVPASKIGSGLWADLRSHTRMLYLLEDVIKAKMQALTTRMETGH